MMVHVSRLRRKKGALLSVKLLLTAAAVGVAIVALAASYRDQIGEMTATYTPMRSIYTAPPTPLPTVVKLGTGPGTEVTGTIGSGRVEVLGADTIRYEGQRYRLAGIDAPEQGLQAKCGAERELAARAAQRLREIVSGGELKFDRVACACENGTEGTLACNDGRRCGVLTASGRDVAAILIEEKLARSYVCGRTQCAPRVTWCREF